jgi:hypothetical protein
LKDAPVPQDVRANINGTLKNLYGALAEDLKDRLNEWEIATAPELSGPLFDTIRAFSGGMQAADELAEQYRDTMKTIVHGASRVTIGFVPFVGPALDLCEAVTGHEYCMPSGRTLTTGERVFSGIGFGVGKLVKVWGGVKTAVISAEGKATAAGIVNLGEEVAEALAKAKIEKWKKLRGSIIASEQLKGDFEKKVVLHLIQEKQHKVLAMGDGVKDVLRLDTEAANASFKIPDFLSVSPQGGLVVSEAKFFDFTTQNIPADKVEEQLRSAMERLVKKNVAQDVERVQLIMPKNAKLGGGYKAKDGYLLAPDGKTVTMPGKPNLFVRILEI